VVGFVVVTVDVLPDVFEVVVSDAVVTTIVVIAPVVVSDETAARQ
jgi:hypothetical protein